MRQYFEGRDLHGGPFVIGPLGQDVVAGLSDAVQGAVQMGKLVEFHTSAPGTLDHPLLQVVRGVGVVVQDVPFLKGWRPQTILYDELSYLDLSSTVWL